MIEPAGLMAALHATTGKDVALRLSDGDCWVAELGWPGVKPEKVAVGATAVEALTKVVTELDHEARGEMERLENARREQVERHEQLAAVLDQGEVTSG